MPWFSKPACEGKDYRICLECRLQGTTVKDCFSECLGQGSRSCLDNKISRRFHWESGAHFLNNLLLKLLKEVMLKFKPPDAEELT